jgi:DNA polymerase-3 subunit delta
VLIKTNKNIAIKDIKSLQNACLKNESSYLIINCFDDKSDKYLAGKLKTMSGNFKDNTPNAQVRFFAPDKKQALQYLSNEANNAGVIANEQSLGYLLDELDNDMYLCINELKKLASLNTPLSRDIIDKYCFNLNDVDTNKLVFWFFESNEIYKIKPQFDSLLLEGYNQINLINSFSIFTSMLIKIKLYQTFSTFNARAIWGYPLPAPIALRYKQIAIKYSIPTLHNLLNFFLKLDLALKVKIKSNKDTYLIVKLLKLFKHINKI